MIMTESVVTVVGTKSTRHPKLLSVLGARMVPLVAPQLKNVNSVTIV